jgi:N-acetyl-anhydromuramyl-L-alanine amidase AmpD
MSGVLASLAGLIVFVSGCAAQESTSLAPLPPPPLEINETSFPISKDPESPSASIRGGSDESDWTAKNPRPWKYVVIHHSATERGSAESFDRSHRSRGMDEMGYHFVITNGSGGADGRIEVGARWRNQKWGAHTGRTPGNEYNNYGIGICLVGVFNERLPSEAQLASLRRLVVFLTSTYDIAPQNVVGHCDAPEANTECPGEKLHAYLNTTFRGSLSALAARE